MAKFDPFKDSWLQPQSFFPTQPITAFGQRDPVQSEVPERAQHVGVSVDIANLQHEGRAHLELRVEAFNVLNRVFFAPLGGATTLGNANWGLWRAQANGWRDDAVGGEDDLVVVCERPRVLLARPLNSMLAAAAADAPLGCEPAGRIE